MIIKILALPLMLSTLCCTDPLLMTSCSADHGNYTTHSQFEYNLKYVLGALSSNLTAGTSFPGFFVDTSIGDSPGTVYGQALCRGDVDCVDCQDCIHSASQEILSSCTSGDAIIWYELCQVRYSSLDFFSSMVYRREFPEHNNREKNVVSNSNQFEKALMNFMKKPTTESAFHSSKRMFAAGEIKFSNKENIYGLSQCTRDISQYSCDTCLGLALEDLRTCCFSRQGGIVLSMNCNVRFELHQFYKPTSKGT